MEKDKTTISEELDHIKNSINQKNAQQEWMSGDYLSQKSRTLAQTKNR